MNLEALEKILKQSGISDSPQNVNLISEEDDYDSYEIQLENGTVWRLKISFDSKTLTLKQEAAVLKKSLGVASGKIHHYGEVQLGEKLPCLIFQFPPALDISQFGKSSLFAERRRFFSSYFALIQTLSPKRLYKSVLQQDFKKFDIKKFPAPSKDSLKTHSNYSLIIDLFTSLKKEVDEKLKNVPSDKKCLGGLPLKSIFLYDDLFFFDYLHKVCLCHPFVDFVDFILDFGVDSEMETAALDDFCDLGGLTADRDLYKDIYDLQLRRSLAGLLGEYLVEVYLFESRRLDKIIYLVDRFSRSVERFRSIPAFLDNQNFWVKTISEPILGVKA
jgi:hypothetical protein